MVLLVVGFLVGLCVPLLYAVAHQAYEWHRITAMQSREGNGRSVVITGAASGIGRAATLLFAAKGWKVIALDINEEGLQETVDLTDGGQVDTVQVDLSSGDSRAQAVEKIKEITGSLCALVNCAGIAVAAPVVGMSTSTLERQINVNLTSYIDLSTMLLDQLLETDSAKIKIGGGVIINLSSTGGDHCLPWQGAYTATKYALEGFADSLRIEAMAANIPLRVVQVKPAGIHTPMVNNSGKLTQRYLEEHPDSVFKRAMSKLAAGGGKRKSARVSKKKSPLGISSTSFMMYAEDVAQTIYAAAVDPYAPHRYRVQNWLWFPINVAGRFLPSVAVDYIFSKPFCG